MSFIEVSAALANAQESPVCIYVRYGKFADEMRVLEQNTRMLHVRLPDRELIITNDNDRLGGTSIYNWDECIPVSPFHKTINNFDFDPIIMINYVEHYGRMDRSNASCQKGCIPNTPKIICDSGGFQIMQGRVDYIDPKNLAKFYNRNADMGIILDIPLYRGVDNDLLVRSAKIQKKNTKKLLENIDDTVELINVCHGYSIDKYMRFLDIVTVEEIDRLCIGGLYMKDLLSGLSEFIHIVDKWKHHYKHFHILGVYNVSVLSCFIYLAEKVYPDILVTADASTPLQSARNGLYHFQREFNKPLERLQIGSRHNKLTYFNKYRTLPCGCPICRAIKYMDVFSFLLSNPMIRALTFHNTIEITRSLGSIAQIARSTEFLEYRKVMEQILSTHTNKEEAQRGFDFIEMYLEHGIEKAEKLCQTQKYQGVFDTISQGSICGREEDSVEVQHFMPLEYKKSVERVIKKYETPGMVETFKLLR